MDSKFRDFVVVFFLNSFLYFFIPPLCAGTPATVHHRIVVLEKSGYSTTRLVTQTGILLILLSSNKNYLTAIY